jgi:hypothetical protein
LRKTRRYGPDWQRHDRCRPSADFAIGDDLATMRLDDSPCDIDPRPRLSRFTCHDLAVTERLKIISRSSKAIPGPWS